MKDYFVRSFQYNAWANQQTMKSLLACPSAHREASPIIAHMLAAENVWLSRLTAKQAKFAVWPSLSIAECEALLAESHEAWSGYLEAMTDDDLKASVNYQNTRGEPFCDAVMDILTHVTIHGGYHRGQIAKMIVRNGGVPAVTDFIVYVRSGAATGSGS